MINRERLAETFKFLVEIDSVSKNEKAVCHEIKKIFDSMGAETILDHAGEKVGSNTGNLITRFEGNTEAPPLLLSAHMDTVGPGTGIKAVFKNGVFTSDGTTILGADDKSAIAIYIEIMRILQENKLPHGPIEFVFTICEEIGLLGAKNLDMGLITAKYGYVLDTENTEGIVTRAPAANSLEFKIHGREAHAGAFPEKGINAILLASKAMAGLELGRIDNETTCNIGMIKGGIATNIVPNLVKIKGEARSLDPEKLTRVTNTIVKSFKDVVETYPRSSAEDLPRLETRINKDFSGTDIPEDHPVVTLAQKAAVNLGRKMAVTTSGGGSDANIFFEKGIITGVIGTGMHNVHTVRESIRLDDMVYTSELLLEIIRLSHLEPV
ncbi:MAG: M20/M25/M40 family metallo-hydrolase [Deltaproteobacteria bacterium]|nr:M20/M25/M40 family metallo-hydrolase [Deltaproteobacteria bacterium]